MRRRRRGGRWEAPRAPLPSWVLPAARPNPLGKDYSSIEEGSDLEGEQLATTSSGAHEAVPPAVGTRGSPWRHSWRNRGSPRCPEGSSRARQSPRHGHCPALGVSSRSGPRPRQRGQRGRNARRPGFVAYCSAAAPRAVCARLACGGHRLSPLPARRCTRRGRDTHGELSRVRSNWCSVTVGGRTFPLTVESVRSLGFAPPWVA